MAKEYSVGQDAESAAFFRSAQSGNERSDIPGQVDQPSVAPIAEAGTDIPGKVDNPTGVGRGA